MKIEAMDLTKTTPQLIPGVLKREKENLPVLKAQISERIGRIDELKIKNSKLDSNSEEYKQNQQAIADLTTLNNGDVFCLTFIRSNTKSRQRVFKFPKLTLEKLPENSTQKPLNINVKKQEIEARIAKREEEIYRLRTINQFVIKFSNEGLSDEERRIYELKEQNRLDKAALTRIDIMG